jgi:CopG family transcriptional regulator/antitoxin EndoAI
VLAKADEAAFDYLVDCAKLRVQAIDVHTIRVYDGYMKGGTSIMRKRINITLPEETLELMDRVTEHGDRSRFIDEAVRHYIQETGRTNLQKRLKEGAIRRANRDLQLTEEWFSVDEEVWQGGRQ